MTRSKVSYITKRTRRHWIFIIGIILLVNLSLYKYFNSYKDKSLSNSLTSLGSGRKYSFNEYAYDNKYSFMVIEEMKSQIIHNKNLRTDHFWEVFDSQVSHRIPYDIYLLEGYDYDDLISSQKKAYIDEMVSSKTQEKMKFNVKFKESFKLFLSNVLSAVEKCRPSIDEINNDAHYLNNQGDKIPLSAYREANGRIPVYGGHLREDYSEEPVRTEEMLSSYLQISQQEMESLRESHSCYMGKLIDDFSQNLYEYSKYNEFMKGDGIVYLGGARYYPLVLLSIKTLRDKGSQLPVEVIVTTADEYNHNYCHEIFPNLNAHCKVMTEYIPNELVENIKGYQLKNVAILISSFQKILYLDADNLPVRNVDAYFVNPPFTNHHLVVWPDMWRRSTSPNYYKIANISVNPHNKIRNSYFAQDPRGKSASEISYHDCEGTIPEASSETGQLLINKKVHFKTLILSIYYNIYGPKYYYALFSQGAAGEGDKETFIAAAHKLQLPYFQVQEFNREFGPHTALNTREYFAMGQYDPIIDYIQGNGTSIKRLNNGNKLRNYYNTANPKIAKNNYDYTQNNYDYHLYRSSKLAFLHANWPKLDAYEIFLLNNVGRGPVHNGKRRRLYTDDLIKEVDGEDFELKIMENLNWMHCELDLKFPFDKETSLKICEEIDKQIEFLKNDKINI